MTSAVFTDEWMQALVDASAGREAVPGLGGVVDLGIGKTVQATLCIVDGRAVGAADAETGAHIPFTGAQLDAWQDGELNLTQAYTKGDLKATGKTGDLLAALELLDDRSIVDGLPRPSTLE